MQKITFEDTEVEKAPYVIVNGQEYPVQSQFVGGTDLNAEVFNQMQNNIEQAINEVQPVIEEWKNIPSDVSLSYSNYLEEYQTGIISVSATTTLLKNYLKKSFMIVKFKNNGVTKYGAITSIPSTKNGYIYLYMTSQLVNAPITDFQYTTNKYLEEIPNDLTWNFIQFLSTGSIADDNIIGFYSNQPVYEPLTKYSTSEQIVGVWTNGKPIYRKTWTGTIEGSYSGSYYQNLPGTSNLVDEIIKAHGYISDTTDKTGNQFYLGYQNKDMSVVKISSGGLRVDTTSSYYHKYFCVTIEYTKNSDSSRSVYLPLWPESSQNER